MQLKEVKRGEMFEHCGHKWIVLGHNTAHTLALSEDIIDVMPFDVNNCNNWAKSSLRVYLNENFFKKLRGNKTADELGFCLYHLDLTTDDGLKDYGSSDDYIFLLTDDLYRRNRDVIKPVDDWWWTATGVSAYAAHSCYSRNVGTDGSLNYSSAYYGGVGVRPACYLKSDLLLSEPEELTVEDEIKKKILELDEILKLDSETRKTVLNYVDYLLKERGIK